MADTPLWMSAGLVVVGPVVISVVLVSPMLRRRLPDEIRAPTHQRRR